MRRLLLISLVAALFALTPATAGARVFPPQPGFIGIAPQGDTEEADYELMELAGVTSMRLPMNWAGLVPRAWERFDPDWTGFDKQVAAAAEHGIRVFPFAWGTPEWVSPWNRGEPVASSRQRHEWMRFLHEAVYRYGPGGRFWSENRELPQLPVRQWEIWNEENIVTFSPEPDPGRFARLIEISGRVLHRADPGSTVILGGLFGRPLQTPPNIPSGAFLSQLYRTPGIKRYFDGVALHPYVADAGAMKAEIESLRRIMALHGDGATPIYVTELGWGSDSYESRWERGPYGQARELDRAFGMLASNRLRWLVGGVWWFSWMDHANACQFCDSAGLLTTAREAKPSWYRFNAWTGGDAGTVQRASAQALLETP